MVNNKKTLILISIFISSLIVSNIIASKLVVIGWVVIPAAVIAYPITFLVTDVIGEVHGKKMANLVVQLGLFSSLIMVVLIYIGQLLPSASFWQGQQAYVQMLSGTPRIVFASLIAYYISQTHDVFMFHYWKKRTNNKFLWFRNNVSTITSQIIDTVLFIIIAFYGVIPGTVLITMILSQYLIKVVMALIDTPFCYIFVSWIRDEEISLQGCVE